MVNFAAQDITLSAHTSLGEIAAHDWDACACPETADGTRAIDPFTRHRFLAALEKSGSVGPGTGWQPHYLVAHQRENIIGVAPMYAKGHSQGEYIFDHGWAHAYERAGGRYYPKLQIAVPHTPATGRRFLTHPDHTQIGFDALLQGAVQIGANNQLSSLHVTFCTEDEIARGAQMGMLSRTGQQFHWHNANYADFDSFLAQLSSRKRKNIRKERAQAQNFGGQIEILHGEMIQPHHWDAFWQFYQDTGARKWGSPYLTRDFFHLAHETLRDDIVLIMARRAGRYVAGALNFWGRETLFGRYWGCNEHHPCLHFELCYYQAMEFAMAQGLARVEAGAQGEHKLARGYMPSATYSMHWIFDPNFAQAVQEYLSAERQAVDEELEILTSYGPFKHRSIEEQQ